MSKAWHRLVASGLPCRGQPSGRDKVVAARRAWTRAQARVESFELEVAAAEGRLDEARYGWEQWDGRSDVLTAMARLEAAKDEEREARREFERARRDFEAAKGEAAEP